MSGHTNYPIKAIVLILAVALFCCQSPLIAEDGANPKLIALIEKYQKRCQTPSGVWPDISANGLHDFDTKNRAALTNLKAIPRNALRLENRELYDLLKWRTECRIDEMRLRLYLTPSADDLRLLPRQGVLGAIDPLWSLPRPATLSEYQERIRILQSFPPYANQVIALLREAVARRMLPGRQLAWQARANVGRWLNHGPGLVRNPFEPNTSMTEAERTLYAPFESMDGVDSVVRMTLQEAARKIIHEQVIPAIQAYYDALSQEYLPACPEWTSLSQWQNGADVYRVLLRTSTTTRVDPAELQKFGSQEVGRIRRQMASLLPRIGFKGSLDEFLVYARTNPEFYFQSGSQLLAAYRDAMQDIEPLLPRIILHVPKMNIRVEGSRDGVAAAYEPPDANHEYDLVNVDISAPSIHPAFEVIPLMLHEGMPGHALQHAVARELASQQPGSVTAFREEARQSAGFVEGWGLYSESLGRTLGLYRTPLEEFGALRMALTRAVRVVMDTGVHLSGWTIQQAKEYAAANTGEPEAQIDSEAGRTTSPGLLPAYAVGAQQIEAMRQLAAKALGGKFDLRSFDDAILRWGPLPLDVMRNKLKDCLDEKPCSQTFQTSTR